MTVVAVPDIPANRSEKENRHLVGETEHTQQRRRTRQFIDQPKLRSGLHPRADKRYELSRDEKLKVAVLHGAEARGHGRNCLPPFVGCRERELVTMP